MHKISKTLSLSTLALLLATNLSKNALAVIVQDGPPHHNATIVTTIAAVNKVAITSVRPHSQEANIAAINTMMTKKQIAQDIKPQFVQNIKQRIQAYGIDPATSAGMWLDAYYKEVLSKIPTIKSSEEKPSIESNKFVAYKMKRSGDDVEIIDVPIETVKDNLRHVGANKISLEDIEAYMERSALIVPQIDSLLRAKNEAQADKARRYLDETIKMIRESKDNRHETMTLKEMEALERYADILKKDKYDPASKSRQALDWLMLDVRRRIDASVRSAKFVKEADGNSFDIYARGRRGYIEGMSPEIAMVLGVAWGNNKQTFHVLERRIAELAVAYDTVQLVSRYREGSKEMNAIRCVNPRVGVEVWMDMDRHILSIRKLEPAEIRDFVRILIIDKSPESVRDLLKALPYVLEEERKMVAEQILRKLEEVKQLERDGNLNNKLYFKMKEIENIEILLRQILISEHLTTEKRREIDRQIENILLRESKARLNQLPGG